jgi:asparagine synthase (glutamine-hydrolysing)
MCGLAGYYSTQDRFSRQDLEAMTEVLAHRGPDASGYFTDAVVGLGHRRLRVIDLSERANQPMTSADGRYKIIYNGEVYNFQEIGARMHRQQGRGGLQLRTSSDTEVILEAFAAYGVDFVKQLNGMFVVVIYDTHEQALYIFRDRIGIKPLYYFWDERDFAFASELKSFKRVAAIPREINADAIRRFLHFGYIPTPLSIYKNIFKMPSGSWMKVSRGGIEFHKYWDLRSKLSNNLITDKHQAMVKLSDLLISSVQYQLKSDVPFGVFLSGGIDSSLVTAQATYLSTVKVNSFSIGFEENSHNESEYAKAIAKYLGTDHHEFIVSTRDAVGMLEGIFDSYDEPFADSSVIPTMLVSKLAKQYVTVTLAGEGGDELFFGYGFYRWARRLSNPFWKAARKPLARLFAGMSSRYQRVGRLLDYRPGDHLPGHIFSQEQYYFSEGELGRLLCNGAPQAGLYGQPPSDSFLRIPDQSLFSKGLLVNERRLNAMEMQALFDLQYYLQDDLLTKVDRASMRFSVETRVPYLDHRVIEFALNLSPHLKYRNGTTKYILKEILFKYIPRHLFDRPKQGFAIPLNLWLNNELRYLVDDYLSETMIERYGLVDYATVQRHIQAFRGGVQFHYNRLWLLIVLHKWLDEYA